MNTRTPQHAVPEAGAPGAAVFPIVGIGASAGGFAALATLFQNLPAAPRMALVVVLHLPTSGAGHADRVLQGWTAMPVTTVRHATPVLPDQVYVIPPGHGLRLEHGRLVLEELARPFGDPDTIDRFFRTLAAAHKENAVGVVLSGMGADGTAGLARIKEQGGVTIAQVPADAEAGSMPQSAIEAGMADFVLTASQIPAKLLELRRNAQAIRQHARDAPVPADGSLIDMGKQPRECLEDILGLLQERTGHDFRQYKEATLLRRLERRLQVRGLRDLPGYCRLLRKDGSESRALLKDLLIGATRFFRDRHAFDALDRLVLPALLRGRQPGNAARTWVVACSTGEEAYTLGILLAGHAAEAETPNFQIFATDIEAQALAAARAGLYPASIATEVPPARLEQFFTREGNGYRVRKTLRDRILFAEHNVLRDPAFSRMDLITCRNFLIYLNRETVRRVLETFHFALNPGAWLMLGSAETADTAPDLFAPVDAAQRLYKARPVSRTAYRPLLRAVREQADMAARKRNTAPRPAPRARMFSYADIHLHKAAGLAPPTILVNAAGEIVHLSERASRFVRAAGGEPTRDLVALLAPELRPGMRSALFRARNSGRQASSGPVHCKLEGARVLLELSVEPFEEKDVGGLLMLVSFRDIREPPGVRLQGDEEERPLPDGAEEELRRTRRELQATIDQAEASGAEMRAAIEELQTTLAQLDAAAAQLETGNARLQSTNEEQKTVIRHLQMSLDESMKAHDDLSNLVASSGVATLFLDRAMRIQRYTPRIADIFNILPGDVGRPLMHIANKLDRPQLAEEARAVFDTLAPMEREVRSRDGRDYIARVQPYRTADGRVEGAVMSFFDISGRRQAEQALRESERRLRALVTATSSAVYRMSPDWSEMRELEGQGFIADTPSPLSGWIEKYIFPEDRLAVMAAICDAVHRKAMFSLEHRVRRADGSAGWTLSRAVPLLDDAGNITEWFGAAIDISKINAPSAPAGRGGAAQSG